MIAYCGLNCDECPSFMGTITGDERQLVKMSEEYGSEKTNPIDFVCLGCKYNDIKLIATDCALCAIRSCARMKDKDFCATCDEFETCDYMKDYRRDGTTALDKRNTFIRAKYFSNS